MADAKSRAAEHVDAAHHRAHAGLKASHAKWERHELNHQLGRVNSIKENRATIDARYVQRIQTIQNKKANMARIIDRQHKSFGGRLEALTPKGRAAASGKAGTASWPCSGSADYRSPQCERLARPEPGRAARPQAAAP